VLDVLDKSGAQVDALPLKRTVELGELYELIQSSGVLVEPDQGYEERSAWMYGLALEAEGRDGSRLLFLELLGGEVSNDHHPAYELLFRAAPGTARFQLVSVNQWFFDVAGIEGMEWYVMFSFFFPLSLVLSWIGLIAFVAGRTKQQERLEAPPLA
jgi:hypothetical protein